jgi:hypothetical protein
MREDPRFSIAFAFYVKKILIRPNRNSLVLVTPRIFFCYPDNKQKIRGVTSTRLAKSQPFVNDLFFDENGLVKDLDEKLDAMLSHDDVTHDCIDDIVSDLQNIFIHTAKSFRIQNRNNLIDKNDSYPIPRLPSWDDHNCSYGHQLICSEVLSNQGFLSVDLGSS